ncbi:NADPH-dependent 2,4-dienoyl-CoA reductase/sulfur reductase-like enzyme [Paraburkholderia eburnea]|uniref:NADPH-dependent 2,4-dienoyl-CoA reductase/sulfur reductase-like enzyme n=1 Tax=Paraburkholderia eburnea TaxID=1189126 RepID=A0A2S4M7R1_9BURK|nr:FAD-dependent oxidoreductase [Paraburkholderia eburnea]POR50701.1 NADPH-dependent 2,4-dienoyl-CoA reductase/sulfur reductase-like enzyme [Paraburkholderia eburnea]PRZ21469.1 NADPH-dependent 2,4-dienoyl-CoA reductase/sulfur reductase-like enzyme [Paraburkholderia eburnea]
MNFDILIIGTGPAGLNAASVAAQAGAEVGIVDDNALPGGQIWRQGPQHRAEGRAREAIDAMQRFPNITYLGGTRVVQACGVRQLLVEDASRGYTIGYGKLIVATGARERFLPYPGWTLPGVTGAGGLQALVKGGMPVRGERIVIAGTGPLLWAAAVTAREQGARVVAIVEQAAPQAVRQFAASLIHTPAKLTQAARMRFDLRATPYLCGAHVSAALGDGQLAHVMVKQGEKQTRIDCDRLACAFGLVPNSTLGTALGCRIDETQGVPAIVVDDLQLTTQPDIYAAGECTGVGGMELSALEGRIAAHAAVGEIAQARSLFAERERYRRFAARMHAAFALDPLLRGLAAPDTVLCRCEDVRFADAAQHGSWRDAKLHTRCGMGPCQGKICGEAAAFCLGWERNGLRAPFSPARIGTLMEAQTQP